MAVRTVWFPDFERSLPSLAGKRVAITGTTSGTGAVAALTCAKLGAEVFMLNRESERAQAALQAVQTACPGAAVRHIPCDLTDFSSVRAAAKELGGALIEHGLDVLCCNAGIMNYPDEATVDGYDVQMQTNHLSHFLLVKELFPCLQVAVRLRGEARIVNHSSLARRGKPLDAKYLGPNGGRLRVEGMVRYHQSKLANIVFTYALDARLKAAGHHNIKVLVCAPGWSDTNLLDQTLGGLGRALCCIKKCMLQSSEDGAMPLLTCIAREDVQSADLVVPSENKERWGPPAILRRPLQGVDAVCQDEGSQTLLWEESEHATEDFVIAAKAPA